MNNARFATIGLSAITVLMVANLLAAVTKEANIAYAQVGKYRALTSQAELRVVATPSESKVSIGGAVIKQGMYKADLSNKETKIVRISVAAPGYVTKVVNATMKRGNQLILPVTLARVKPNLATSTVRPSLGILRGSAVPSPIPLVVPSPEPELRPLKINVRDFTTDTAPVTKKP